MPDVVSPWDKRASELEPSEGTYCHYAAWKEWLDAWNARQSSALELDMDVLDMVALYCAFCAAVAESKKPDDHIMRFEGTKPVRESIDLDALAKVVQSS